MSYTMTFNSLQDDVRRYLERGFTSASDPIVFEQIPRLINTAERRIGHELKLQGFVRNVQTTLAVGDPVYQKPDRWRETISITINGAAIFARSLEYVKNYWPNPALTGTPEFYADYNYNFFLLAPTPSTAATMEIAYYELPALLDDSNQENWLTKYAPNLLLYGTLLETTPFLKNDERIGVWQSFYDRHAQALTTEDMGKVMDRTANRSEV